MPDLTRRIEALEQQQTRTEPPALRFVISHVPLNLEPTTPPGPMCLVVGGREYDPRDLGW